MNYIMTIMMEHDKSTKLDKEKENVEVEYTKDDKDDKDQSKNIKYPACLMNFLK